MSPVSCVPHVHHSNDHIYSIQFKNEFIVNSIAHFKNLNTTIIGGNGLTKSCCIKAMLISEYSQQINLTVLPLTLVIRSKCYHICTLDVKRTFIIFTVLGEIRGRRHM